MLLRLLGQNKLTFKQNNRRYVIEISFWYVKTQFFGIFKIFEDGF